MTGEYFLRELSARLHAGPAVLATVRRVTGSTPRYAGAQMGCGEGWLLGTIGGGAAESRVIDAAREAMHSEGATELMIDLRGTSEKPRDGICGGVMNVRLDPLGTTAIDSIDAAISAIAKGAVVQQHFPDKGPWSLQIVEPTQLSSLDGDIDWIVPDPFLLIVGGGHCGMALARVASTLGFRVLIQDDRTAVATDAMLPEGCLRSCESVAETLKKYQWQGALYAAIVSRSYQHDIDALEALASINCGYIGLMGSKRRVAEVRSILRTRDVDDNFLNAIDSPIGIPIGAESPEEIAVSICAKLIEVRGSRLSSSQCATTKAT